MRPLAGFIFGVVLAVALTPVAALSGPLEDGQDASTRFKDGVVAYDLGDYKTALRLWRPLAEQTAQYSPGADAHSILVTRGAQYSLGYMYAEGQGVPQDYAEALKWFGLAAEQGHVGAHVALGVMYDNGQGVPQDYAEAVKLYRLAAEQDNAGGQYNLGRMYADGQGVVQDFVQAHRWFNLAASRLPSGADRDKAVKNRDAAAKHMTPA